MHPTQTAVLPPVSPIIGSAPADDAVAGDASKLRCNETAPSQVADHWDHDDSFPIRPGGAIALRPVTPREGSGTVSTASSFSDLARMRDLSRPMSPFPSRPRSDASDASVVDLMATQVEAIIVQQRLGQEHFGAAQHLCQELLAYGGHCRELLMRLLHCSDLNLPLFSLLSGDTATFRLLDQHGLAFAKDNHFVFQVYATIAGAESPSVCDYYDAQIAEYVTHDDIDTLDLPRHVLAFLKALSARDDARYLVYLCQSVRVAAQCALLADDVALATRVMREPMFVRRPIIASSSSSESSLAS